MVNVTERAKDKLKKVLEAKTKDASVALRLEPTAAGQFAVFPDRDRADDEVVEHHGTVVLLVGQEIAQTVGNTTIDCDEAGPGSRLVIRRS